MSLHKRCCRKRPFRPRRLRVEALEDRRLLAVLTVQNNLDDSLANLAGDGELSLREAIEIANHPGTTIDGFTSNDVDDTIEFASSLSGQTITLDGTELSLTESVNIDASGLANRLTIDANQQSRIFSIDTADGDYVIRSVEMTGGRTTGSSSVFTGVQNGGGAIRFRTDGTLTISDSKVYGNMVEGGSSHGGGVFAEGGKLRIERSEVSGNISLRGSGGGIYSGGLEQTPQEIVFTGALEIEQSTVSGNLVLWPTGNTAGGGVFTRGTLLVSNSTISGNRSNGRFGSGGIHASGTVSLDRTTITDNHAASSYFQARGGGIAGNGPFVIRGSIVANNTAQVGANDIQTNAPDIAFSLIGDTTGTVIDGNIGVGNTLDVDPLLGPLSDNGGPTQTHALLPGSPALEAGDPNVLFDPSEFDERGAPFHRVAAGIILGIPQQIIDVGAYEAQFPPSADYVDDDQINGADFLAWQLGHGLTMGAAPTDGNSDDDDDVDQSDLAAWQVSYGQVESPPPPVGGVRSDGWVEAALAWESLEAAAVEEEVLGLQQTPIAGELVGSHEIAQLAPSTRATMEVDSVTTVVDRASTYEHAWLTNELLERVFG